MFFGHAEALVAAAYGVAASPLPPHTPAPPPMLAQMEDRRIFDITKDGSDFVIGECCDHYFITRLTSDELRQLGQEIVALSETDRPPHFPDPNADPIAVLEQALRDKDDIIADQYREMTAWREQLEAALAQIKSMEAANVHPRS